MPLDDHRAPNRLATQYPRGRQRTHQSSNVSPPSHRVSDHPDQAVPDYEVIEEQYWEPPLSPGDSGTIVVDNPEPAPVHDARTDYDRGSIVEAGETAAVVPHESPGDMPDSMELTKQELHQLLMHTVQLYGDVWKLSGVRADPDRRMLVAYLTPRQKQMELKEAIRRHQALIITIDRHGNTNIREPHRRGLLRWLTAWLTGD